MPSSASPIGVFDSGLGGLSVLNELRRALPSENFIYLGDVARLPYGTKSAAVVTRYAESCLEFLVSKGVKLVVIACNTATANALTALRDKSLVDVVGVIEPGVAAGIEASGEGRVLVLATAATVKSEAYLRGFHEKSPGLSVEQLACPLLVPLAEEGWFDHPVTERVIESYLRSARETSYDVIVLGCTHYPLLEKSFRAVAPGAVLVHGGKKLAEEVKGRLSARGELNTGGAAGWLRFYSTDHIPASVPIVSALFGGPVEFELTDL